jgi:hypothetical protein
MPCQVQYVFSMNHHRKLLHLDVYEISHLPNFWLFITSNGWCGLLTFREITIVSVFWELKLTKHLLTDFVCLYTCEFWVSLCKIVRGSVILLLPLLDQDVIVFKSLLKMSADSIALSTIRNILVSSANNLTWDWILPTISFMYNKKRSGSI